jgi:hypothetical protein
MAGVIHTRRERWDEVPFSSLEEVATFAGELLDAVNEAAPEPLKSVSVMVTYEDSRTEQMPLDEFMAEAQDETLAPIGEATEIYVTTSVPPKPESGELPPTATLETSLYISISEWRTHAALHIEGERLTAVEGVRGALKPKLDRYLAQKKKEEEMKEAAKEARRRAAQRDEQAADLKQERADTPTIWQRIVDSDYTVEIVGGLIVLVIAAFASLLWALVF